MKFLRNLFEKPSQRKPLPPPKGGIGGEIVYFKLEDWWLNTLSAEEREIVLHTYKPLGGSAESLVNGKISHHSGNAIWLLTGLAGWFYKPENVSIAIKALEYAESISSRSKILDRHFLFQQMIETYYKLRTNEGCLDKAIAACHKQIAIAPKAAQRFIKEYGPPLPSHKGFEQLSIILWNQNKASDAIDICDTAASQGWAGDWNRRIERYRKGLAT